MISYARVVMSPLLLSQLVFALPAVAADGCASGTCDASTLSKGASLLQKSTLKESSTVPGEKEEDDENIENVNMKSQVKYVVATFPTHGAQGATLLSAAMDHSTSATHSFCFTIKKSTVSDKTDSDGEEHIRGQSIVTNHGQKLRLLTKVKAGKTCCRGTEPTKEDAVRAKCSHFDKGSSQIETVVDAQIAAEDDEGIALAVQQIAEAARHASTDNTTAFVVSGQALKDKIVKELGHDRWVFATAKAVYSGYGAYRRYKSGGWRSLVQESDDADEEDDLSVDDAESDDADESDESVRADNEDDESIEDPENVDMKSQVKYVAATFPMHGAQGASLLSAATTHGTSTTHNFCFAIKKSTVSDTTDSDGEEHVKGQSIVTNHGKKLRLLTKVPVGKTCCRGTEPKAKDDAVKAKCGHFGKGSSQIETVVDAHIAAEDDEGIALAVQQIAEAARQASTDNTTAFVVSGQALKDKIVKELGHDRWVFATAKAVYSGYSAYKRMKSSGWRSLVEERMSPEKDAGHEGNQASMEQDSLDRTVARKWHKKALKIACTDSSKLCPYLKRFNWCRIKPHYMKAVCRKSCGICKLVTHAKTAVKTARKVVSWFSSRRRRWRSLAQETEELEGVCGDCRFCLLKDGRCSKQIDNLPADEGAAVHADIKKGVSPGDECTKKGNTWCGGAMDNFKDNFKR